MKLIDLHCDTLWKLMDLSGNGDLMKNDGCVSIEAMKKGGTMAQFFACFTYAEDYKETGGYDAAWQHVLEMIACLKEQTRIYADQISLATSCQEMRGKCRTREDFGISYCRRGRCAERSP